MTRKRFIKLMMAQGWQIREIRELIKITAELGRPNAGKYQSWLDYIAFMHGDEEGRET